MNIQKKKNLIRERRHARVRAKVQGTAECPRLSVFRSARYIYAQLIDDVNGKTLISADGRGMKTQKPKNEKTEKQLDGKVAAAFAAGKLLAEKASEKGIKKVVFDRGGYKYHGRVKALAEGAREGGLEF